MIKLNIGSGEDYKEGYINIDMDKNIKADYYYDLSKGLPFAECDEIYCKNVFEHIPNPLDFLINIRNSLKKGGKAVIITSNASYIMYHIRKKAFHDTYNLTHPISDQHYFMFQKGHLEAFTKQAGMKLLRLDYHIQNERKCNDRRFQIVLGAMIGKKFGYSDFIWELEK